MKKSILPTHFASMTAMENAVGTPRKFIRFALNNGAGRALTQHQSSRIDPWPILHLAAKYLKRVANGELAEKGETQGTPLERAKIARMEAQTKKLNDEQMVRDGRLVDIGAVEKQLWENTLSPLRSELLALPKKLKRQREAIMGTQASAEEKAKQCADATTASIDEILEKLRGKK